MKTLLHICCAPCANQCVELLRSESIEVSGFWYNPNIHPYTEYRERRNCVQAYAKAIDLPLVLKDEYALRPFVREVAEDLNDRCGKCYRMRLFETARQAKEGGFDYFTTTLSISPLKNAEKLNEIGEKLENEYGVKHLTSDFKKKNGYKRSTELSKEYDLYRQDYCGCVFSKNEREKQKMLVKMVEVTGELW